MKYASNFIKGIKYLNYYILFILQSINILCFFLKLLSDWFVLRSNLSILYIFALYINKSVFCALIKLR